MDEMMMVEGKHRGWIESRKIHSGSNRRMREMTSVISELTRDGQMVIRRFIPSDETQQLSACRYLFIDSDDRMFVADEGYLSKVILFDSDLKWNRILYPTNEKLEEQLIGGPWRMFYDEEMKQFIIGGFYRDHTNVYTLSRN